MGGSGRRPTTFKLEYKAGNKWVLIADGLQTSVYTWTVPAITGDRKRPLSLSMVRVTGFNSTGKKVGSDQSDKAFTIEIVRLTSPNGGETLTSGSTPTIQWTTFGTARPVTKVDLQYQIKKGNKWLPIITITGPDPRQLRLACSGGDGPTAEQQGPDTLSDATGILGQDVSDAVFTITPAPAP